MPRRDGNGPMGIGELTGRGFGGCTGTTETNYRAGFGGSPRSGLSHRRGFGRGRGINGAIDQNTVGTQKERLQNQKELLKRRLDVIDKHLEEV